MRPLTVRLFLAAALTIAVGTTLVVPGRAQDMDFSKVTFKVTKLAPNLHMIEGVGGFSGGNIAVAVGPDGLVVVDSSMPPLSEKLRAAIKTISPLPVKMIINTHAHADHAMGNAAFGKDAIIVAHQKTRERLVKDGFGEAGKATPDMFPDLTLEDHVRLYWGDEEIRATVVPPAHTNTDVTVTFSKQNVVHLGDLFFNGMYPFIDADTGGDARGYLAAVEKAVREIPADAKIIPGHGPLATRKDLETYLAMLKDTIGAVDKGIAAGKSLDELKKAKLFARYDATWGSGFFKSDDYTEILYKALKAPAR